MISQETFNKLELEHGCGYWNLCYEHAYPCAITVEHKGLQQNIWDSMVKENREVAEEHSEIDESDIEEYDYTYEDYHDEDDMDEECPFCHVVPTPSGSCGCSNI